MENPGVIYPHQARVFQKLLITATAFDQNNWWSLPVLPRWHMLIIAPTGVGKSHMVRAVGKALDWPIYSIYISRWIVGGGRGKETWPEIAQWLSKQNGKCLLFIDEIDKVSTTPYATDIWSRHQLCEIYQLLDRDLPAEIEIDDEGSEHSKEALWARAKMNLQCHTLIVAAGAFQSLWCHRPKSLGFSEGENSASQIPSQKELEGVLPIELINRFGKIVAMSPMIEGDYKAMINQTTQVLPREIRSSFSKIAKKNLPNAIFEAKGTRYVEECITQALIDDSELKLDGNKGKRCEPSFFHEPFSDQGSQT